MGLLCAYEQADEELLGQVLRIFGRVARPADERIDREPVVLAERGERQASFR